MKKNLTILVFILFTNFTFSQDKLITRTAKTSFFSKTPIENIYAENNQSASILLLSKKTIAFNVLLKSFKFEKALMEEHFNEKYVHSETYPAAKFKGTFDVDLTEPKKYDHVVITGKMNFHGVNRQLKAIAQIEVKADNTILLSCNFKLNLEDYNIEVTSLLKDKIAPDIEVAINAYYK